MSETPRSTETPRVSRSRALSLGRRSRPARSPTAVNGIALLKKGCEAVKYSRHGKPRKTTFHLSSNEQTLTWDSARGVSPIKRIRGERHSVQITEILEIMLGMESKIFALHNELTGGRGHPMAHLSMTLVLVGSLLQLPGESSKGSETRETLDLSFKDEETFGLWVAALRALMSETEPVFFTKIASPLNPVNASAIASIRKKAPDDAHCTELLRDAILQLLLTKAAAIANIVWILGTAGCGTWWATTLLGWWDSFYIIYPDCPGVELKGGCYNATRDGDYYLQKTDYANIAIQVVRGLLTYQGLCIVGPWRATNFWHLTLSRRSCEPGLDLYGRPTDSIWYCIPPRPRLRIILLYLGNIFFQVLLQGFAIGYYSYELDQSTAGTLSGLSCMLLSIGCAVGGAVLQSKEQHAVHLANPDQFAPDPIFHAIEKLKRRRAQQRARHSIHREVEFMRSRRVTFANADGMSTDDEGDGEGGEGDGDGSEQVQIDIFPSTPPAPPPTDSPPDTAAPRKLVAELSDVTSIELSSPRKRRWSPKWTRMLDGRVAIARKAVTVHSARSAANTRGSSAASSVSSTSQTSPRGRASAAARFSAAARGRTESCQVTEHL